MFQNSCKTATDKGLRMTFPDQAKCYFPFLIVLKRAHSEPDYIYISLFIIVLETCGSSFIQGQSNWR